MTLENIQNINIGVAYIVEAFISSQTHFHLVTHQKLIIYYYLLNISIYLLERDLVLANDIHF